MSSCRCKRQVIRKNNLDMNTINNTQLVRLFVTLEGREMSKFVKLWEQRQHYEGVDGVYLYRLFDYLKKNHEKEKKLDKTKVFEYIYDKRIFDNRTLTLLLSKGHKTLEKYIINLELDYETSEKSLQKQMILIRYLKRQLSRAAKQGESNERLFNRYYREIKRLYEQILETPKKDIFAYLDVYMLSHLRYYNVGMRRLDEGKFTMQILLDSLDKFMYIAKLRYGNEVLIRQRILDEEIEASLLDEIRQSDNEIDTESDVLIEFHQRYYELIANETYQKEKFINLRNFVFERISKVSFSEGTTILVLLMNYASWAARYKYPVAEISLEIYRFGFANEYFIDEGIVYPMLLINYCFYYSKLGKSYEIPAILNRHLKQIKSDKRDMTEKLCLAHRDFGQGDYKAAFVELLKPGPETKSMFFLTYRCLKIKSLYMLGRYSEDDKTFYEPHKEAQNYIDLLTESQYNEVVKTSNRNFAEFVIMMNSNQHTKRKLQEQLEDYETIVYYDWLLSMLDVYAK